MADVFMYADETGNLDLSGGPGASRYFGIGTATWVGDHGRQLWEGLELRFGLEAAGVRQTKGFHAKNDSGRTRAQVFHLIRKQAPRFDTTFLDKSLAYPSITAKGQLYFFQLAWLLHFRQIALQVSEPGDRLFVIVATLQTNARKLAVAEALTDVLAQTAPGHEKTLCVWDSATSWGLQVADYGLWAVQRELESGEGRWLESCIRPTLQSVFMPFRK